MKNIKAIRGLAIAIRVISIVSRVFLAIGFVAVFAVSLLLLLMPKKTVSADVAAAFDSKISMPFLSGALSDEVVESNDNFYLETQSDGTVYISALKKDLSFDFTINRLGIITLGSLSGIICTYIVMMFVGKLGKTISSSETPFTLKTVKYLKCIGYSLLALVIVPGIVYPIATMIAIPSNGFHISFNISMSSVVLVLLFILLIYIFQYGVKLQQESDETL